MLSRIGDNDLNRLKLERFKKYLLLGMPVPDKIVFLRFKYALCMFYKTKQKQARQSRARLDGFILKQHMEPLLITGNI